MFGSVPEKFMYTINGESCYDEAERENCQFPARPMNLCSQHFIGRENKPLRSTGVMWNAVTGIDYDLLIQMNAEGMRHQPLCFCPPIKYQAGYRTGTGPSDYDCGLCGVGMVSDGITCLGQCVAGYYLSGSKCNPCPPGTWSEAGGTCTSDFITTAAATDAQAIAVANAEALALDGAVNGSDPSALADAVRNNPTAYQMAGLCN